MASVSSLLVTALIITDTNVGQNYENTVILSFDKQDLSFNKKCLCFCVCVRRAEDPGHDTEPQWSPQPKSLHAPPSSSTSASHHTHRSHTHHKLRPVTAGEWRFLGHQQPRAEVTGEPWTHAFTCIVTTSTISNQVYLQKESSREC